MRHFEPGDLVYLRRYDERIDSWCMSDDHPYFVIEAGNIVTIMGGSRGIIKIVPAAMLICDEETRIFKKCRERK